MVNCLAWNGALVVWHCMCLCQLLGAWHLKGLAHLLVTLVKVQLMCLLPHASKVNYHSLGSDQSMERSDFSMRSVPKSAAISLGSDLGV